MNCENIHPALIVIPDIGGFTKYMNETDLAHSLPKITQLLETILESNILRLKVSEIEGDAILFYGFNNQNSFDEVIEHCNRMHKSFHSKLTEFKDSCKCEFCNSLQSLSLKCIVHYGALVSVMVGDYCKLFGKDLIIAHRLLKSHVPVKEYLLLSDDFLKNYRQNEKKSVIRKADLARSDIFIEDIGLVKFSYKEFTNGKNGNF